MGKKNDDGGAPVEVDERSEVELKAVEKVKKRAEKIAKSSRGKAMRLQKNAEKRARRDARQKLRKKLGDKAPAKQEPKTIENTREADDTYVKEDDEEVLHDTEHDNMAGYFNRETTPKVLITTSPKARANTWKFCFELRKCIPNAEIYSRKNVAIKRIVKDAIEREFTDLLIVHEDKKMPNGIVLCHLPEGPTAYFKINSLQFTKEIRGAGESTGHCPEVVLNNFNTRLGHTVARMLACLFPHNPQFTGRRVVTFHNQRDYIFFRHHRYEFKREGEKAALHELGPRFTLRLKWLQKGTFNTREGEYEWVLKRHEMETSRRKFFL
ncbi:Brix domain containing protein [Aphelenchoides avenae]|nr:Brix domain containing protein [Aphelenchus avenae]